MKTIETSGKTVEDAIKAGLKELGCDISEVNHEVVDPGSPGLFGMFGRLAKVRLTVKEDDPDLDFNMPVLTLDPQTEDKKSARKGAQDSKGDGKTDKPSSAPAKPARAKKPAKPAKQEEQAPAPSDDADVKDVTKEVVKEAVKEVVKEAAKEVSKEAAKEGEPRARKEKSARREKAPRKDAPKPAEKPQADAPDDALAGDIPIEPREELPPLDVSKLTQSGLRAYEFLSTVTKLMGMQVDIRILEAENHLTVSITGDALGVLIGRRGETMDALQYLTSLNVNRDKSDYTRVSLDVEHYRAKREETLRRLAIRMANRAKKTGRRVVLEPMNPYERRVMHSALQNNPHVNTHSEGEEPYRRVIITLK